MNKKEWNSVEFDIIEYDVEDVIITSTSDPESQGTGMEDDPQIPGDVTYE